MKELFPHIAVDPTVQFGKPIIAGTRIPVEIIVGHLAAGTSIPDMMQEYRLTQEQVFAALKYASKIVAEETVMVR